MHGPKCHQPFMAAVALLSAAAADDLPAFCPWTCFAGHFVSPFVAPTPFAAPAHSPVPFAAPARLRSRPRPFCRPIFRPFTWTLHLALSPAFLRYFTGILPAPLPVGVRCRRGPKKFIFFYCKSRWVVVECMCIKIYREGCAAVPQAMGPAAGSAPGERPFRQQKGKVLYYGKNVFDL